ncbi:carbon storage regulator [Legionella pneumophila serogroup 1]|uniref:carbon storage regulator n=1 Tax=Legionella pneumophila TaxID=446 RepID=UPI0004942973|nr:carbon storage regulator [Legionella pneumophila]HAT8829864.1 carbon storage regulator [Legionella pneumophila subsp. pneumophila]MCZ4678728.1 carbon storage regulator [Legionella pneumophila]MCZ4703524.1 carbon storage regulator [Legionella pneumophila]MCZ4738887.1 carbon storage regulator [Legionella pneumophila]MCZ4750501.1 carbon storage regulator [Legionella pneumophila]
MLILIRRMGEEIYIDKGRIKVLLISENEGLIKLGIDAPKHVDVERKEVFIQKAIEQHALAQELRNKSTEQSGGNHA